MRSAGSPFGPYAEHYVSVLSPGDWKALESLMHRRSILLVLSHSIRIPPFMTNCAAWLFIHAALLFFPSDPSGKTRRTALPTRRERYFHYLHAFASGKRHP
jgi:hypothetical protein